MKIALVVIVSYLLTALQYVMRDMALPVTSRPAYVRGSLSAKIVGGLVWLPVTILTLPTNARRWKFLRSSLFSISLFVLFILFGVYRF